MKVAISGAAAEDLAQIYAWLLTSRDSETAERFRVRAERALQQLGKHPELGPRPAWITRHKRLRFWIISGTSYIIYYEPGPNIVSVERVLDGRRDVRRLIEAGRETN